MEAFMVCVRLSNWQPNDAFEMLENLVDVE